MSSRMKDITGQRFGTLTVVGMYGVNSFSQARCLVECDCGTRKVVLAHNLRRNMQTCGGPAHTSRYFVKGTPLRDYCSLTGLNYDTIQTRIKRMGMTPEEAVAKPIRFKRKQL